MMSKMWRKFMVSFVAASALVGCGTATDGTSNETTESAESAVSDSSAAGDAAVTLEMLVPGYDTGYLQEPLDNAIAKYEAENPDVQVEIISAEWEELNSKIVQLYQADQAPDIMMMGSRSIRQFAEQGVLEDMTPYLTDDFLAGRIENVMETAEIDGAQYGIPMALSTRALFYRSDLIEEVPTNWDELLATAKQVSEEHDMYGFAIPTDLTSGTDEILNFVYQNSGRVVDDNGDYTINDSKNVAAIEYLTGFKDVIPNPVDTAREDQVKMFVNGDLAMFISGGWEQEELETNAGKAPYSVALLPAGAEKAVTLVTDSYGMSSISDNKEEAFDFITYMGEEEQQRTISESYNWLPVTKAELEDERFDADFMKPFVAILESGVPEPTVPNWDDFNKSFTIAVQKALTGQATAQEALDTAQEEVAQ